MGLSWRAWRWCSDAHPSNRIDWLSECVYVEATYFYDTGQTYLRYRKPFGGGKMRRVIGDDLHDEKLRQHSERTLPRLHDLAIHALGPEQEPDNIDRIVCGCHECHPELEFGPQEEADTALAGEGE